MELNNIFDEKSKTQEFKNLVKFQKIRNKNTSKEDIENICLISLWKVLKKYGDNEYLYRYVNKMFVWEYLKFYRKNKKGYVPTYSNIDILEKKTYDFEKMIEFLNDYDKKILRFRFIENKTLEEIGKEIGCSKQYARIVLKNVINKLKKVYNVMDRTLILGNLE